MRQDDNYDQAVEEKRRELENDWSTTSIETSEEKKDELASWDDVEGEANEATEVGEEDNGIISNIKNLEMQ